MKTLIINCSPKAKISLTGKSIKFLDKMFPEDEFTMCIDCVDHLTDEVKAAIPGKDLVIFTSSIFHGTTHAQMTPMMEEYVSIADKSVPVTYFTTSNMLCENFAHNYMKSFFTHRGIKFLRSDSMRDECILSDRGKEELYNWFAYLKSIVLKEELESKVVTANYVKTVSGSPETPTAVIIDSADKEDPDILAAVAKAKAKFEKHGIPVDVLTLRDTKINYCSACMLCYSDRECVVKDDFDSIVNQVYSHDIIITACMTDSSQFSTLHEKFIQRHVEFGRSSVDANVIMGSIVKPTEYSSEADLAIIHERELAIQSLGHTFYVDTILDTGDNVENMVDECIRLAKYDVIEPLNMYDDSLNRNFADLSYYLQNMQPLCYKYYLSHGYLGPRKMETHVRYINKSDKIYPGAMRTLMFDEAYEKFKVDKMVRTIRRPDKDKPFTDRMRHPSYENFEIPTDQPKKKGFFSKK